MVKTKNKIWLLVLLMLAIIPCAFLLVGCSEGEEGESVYGRYVATGYRTEFRNAGVLEHRYDKFSLDEVDEGMWVILNEDGSGAQGQGDSIEYYNEFEFQIVDGQILVKSGDVEEYQYAGYIEGDTYYYMQVAFGPDDNEYGYNGEVRLYTAFELVKA